MDSYTGVLPSSELNDVMKSLGPRSCLTFLYVRITKWWCVPLRCVNLIDLITIKLSLSLGSKNGQNQFHSTSEKWDLDFRVNKKSRTFFCCLDGRRSNARRYRLTPQTPYIIAIFKNLLRTILVAVPEMLICKNGNIKVFDCMICAVKLHMADKETKDWHDRAYGTTRNNTKTHLQSGFELKGSEIWSV